MSQETPETRFSLGRLDLGNLYAKAIVESTLEVGKPPGVQENSVVSRARKSNAWQAGPSSPPKAPAGHDWLLQVDLGETD